VADAEQRTSLRLHQCPDLTIRGPHLHSHSGSVCLAAGACSATPHSSYLSAVCTYAANNYLCVVEDAHILTLQQ
jgi:hypothetical protein